MRSLGNTPPADASPLRQDVLAAVTKAAHARYPGIPVVPAHGAVGDRRRDLSRRTAFPRTAFPARSSKRATPSAHGLNERLPVESFYGELTHWYVLLKELAGKR